MRKRQAIVLGIATITGAGCAFGAEQQARLTSFQGPATYDGRTLKQVFVAEYGAAEKTEREVSIECNRGNEPYIRLPIELLKSDLTLGEAGSSSLQGDDENDASAQGFFLVRDRLSSPSIRIKFRPKFFNEKFLPQLYRDGISSIKLMPEGGVNRHDIYKILVTEPTVKKRVADLAFLCPTFD